MKRIPTLDGWRAVAITAVVIHHLARWFYQQESAYNLSVTRFGAFGVDVFFGLSGLLITKLLLDEFGRTGAFDLRGFYIRRAFRILPPYLMFLAVITVAGMWRSGWEAASCLLFFRNYVPDSLARRRDAASVVARGGGTFLSAVARPAGVGGRAALEKSCGGAGADGGVVEDDPIAIRGAALSAGSCAFPYGYSTGCAVVGLRGGVYFGQRPRSRALGEAVAIRRAGARWRGC